MFAYSSPVATTRRSKSSRNCLQSLPFSLIRPRGKQLLPDQRLSPTAFPRQAFFIRDDSFPSFDISRELSARLTNPWLSSAVGYYKTRPLLGKSWRKDAANVLMIMALISSSKHHLSVHGALARRRPRFNGHYLSRVTAANVASYRACWIARIT
jgi:hypothetical protein